VRVADVFVGTVRAIDLQDWVARLTLSIDNDVRLPANAIAAIGQTSLLGTQHVELSAPPDPSTSFLKDGDIIPRERAKAYPTTERTLASIATVLRGGGIPNLDVIQNEVVSILDGNAQQIRDFFGKLDTFTDRLNQQRDDIVRAIDSADALLAYVAERDETLDRVLTEVPSLVEYFAQQRALFTDAVEALGRLANVTGDTLSDARADLDQNLQLLQRPLKELARAAPYLPTAVQLIFTQPFTIDSVRKIVRGDYINISGLFDLTSSAIDNSILTGTGLSGMLRALEQSWGRDPATMIPDVRFTPNPADAPVERAE
jgi:phospholipid/cholesterol/gamma-HCH transport system substrate-binding protein